MLTCKEAVRLISEGLDRHLSWPTRLGLRMHLLMCRHCSAYGRQLRGLARLFHLRFTDTRSIERSDETLTPETRERMKSTLRRKPE
ncbi:MAG: zf-HC2 domain-containing protein [Planctomycetes bacterium]|nr:zf-HC2 domain-containing protein [Planctomycetota bacterium]